jgi:phosphoglycolate phosphatase
MTKIAIFDLDGTLLNTIADLGAATNFALKTLGFPERELKEYNQMVGRGIFNLFRAALPESSSNDGNVQKMADLFIPYYNEHMCDLTRPYDGIHQMLIDVTKAGIQVAVASNKYQAGAEKIIRHFFNDIKFKRILGQRDDLPVKPDPEIVKEIISDDSAIAIEDVIYIGDSNVDMQTGINAKVRTIGVLWGFRSREELESYHPWRLAENPKQLESFILE